METILRLGFFLGLLMIFACLEYLFPRRRLSQAKSLRWAINLGLVILNAVLMRLLFGMTLFTVGLYGQEHLWGLMRWMSVPAWANFVAGILILDWAVWFQHWLFHRISWIWPLHRVHHTDLDFDVSTGLRFHPLEIIPSMFFKSGVVLLFGIAPWAALVFEIILNGFSQFTHTNLLIPVQLEKIVRWVFVTPEMHRIHHSVKREEYNRNFGFSFSWWDKIFGTYRAWASEPQQIMKIGIHEFRDQRQLGIVKLLTQPFIKKRTRF